MIAPSITTPELTYFHSATSSLRASATIIGFFKRPPFCAIRFVNQQDSVEVGWCRNHSHASSTMVALRRDIFLLQGDRAVTSQVDLLNSKEMKIAGVVNLTECGP